MRPARGSFVALLTALAASGSACARSDDTGRVAKVPAAADSGPMLEVRGEAPQDLRSAHSPSRPRRTDLAGESVPEVRPPNPSPEPVPKSVPKSVPHPDWPTRVIRFTSTAGTPATIWVGDSLALAPPPAPDGTPPSIAADLRWRSLALTVATVSPNGVISARATGAADIVAWRRVGETITPVTVLPAIRGRVVAADDAPIRATIVVRGADWADSTTSRDDGSFAIRLASPVDGIVSLRIDAHDATHAPAFVATAPLDRLADVDVVLLPTRWRIGAGSYAGTVVPIVPSVAHATARDARRLWHVAHPSRDDRPDDGHAVGWSADQLPLRLALDHRGGTIDPGDSAAFWAIARQVERDWGRPLFRATTIASGSDAFGGIAVSVDPHIRADGLTTTGWNGDGDLYDAEIALRSRALLANPAVVTHELLHALGVGHAAATLASVMHPVVDGSGRASAADVAYGQLLYAVRAHARPARTVVGVAEAAAAEARS